VETEQRELDPVIAMPYRSYGGWAHTSRDPLSLPLRYHLAETVEETVERLIIVL
jgi:hypothetical protein